MEVQSMEGLIIFLIVCLSCWLRIEAGTVEEDISSQFTWQQTVADAFDTEARFYASKIKNVTDEIKSFKGQNAKLLEQVKYLENIENDRDAEIAELAETKAKTPIVTPGQAGTSEVRKLLDLQLEKTAFLGKLEYLPFLPEGFNIVAAEATKTKLRKGLKAAIKVSGTSLNDVEQKFKSLNALHQKLFDSIKKFDAILGPERTPMLKEYQEHLKRIKAEFVKITFKSDAVVKIRQELDKLSNQIERYRIEKKLIRTNNELKKYKNLDFSQVSQAYMSLHKNHEQLLICTNNAKKQKRKFITEVENLDKKIMLWNSQLKVLQDQQLTTDNWIKQMTESSSASAEEAATPVGEQVGEQISGAKLEAKLKDEIRILTAENQSLLEESKLFEKRIQILKKDNARLEQRIKELRECQFKVDEKNAELEERCAELEQKCERLMATEQQPQSCQSALKEPPTLKFTKDTFTEEKNEFDSQQESGNKTLTTASGSEGSQTI